MPRNSYDRSRTRIDSNGTTQILGPYHATLHDVDGKEIVVGLPIESRPGYDAPRAHPVALLFAQTLQMMSRGSAIKVFELGVAAGMIANRVTRNGPMYSYRVPIVPGPKELPWCSVCWYEPLEIFLEFRCGKAFHNGVEYTLAKNNFGDLTPAPKRRTRT